MLIDFKDARWTIDSNGEWLCLKIAEHQKIIKACEMVKDKPCEVEIRHKKKKRSLDANRYCWTLLEKLAEELNIPKEEIYREQVRNVPQKPLKVLVMASEVEEEIKLWSKNGLGWYADVVGESTEHKGFVWIDKFKGSSQFDTKQMSILIDNVICECQDFGIETMPPAELEALKGAWR